MTMPPLGSGDLTSLQRMEARRDSGTAGRAPWAWQNMAGDAAQRPGELSRLRSATGAVAGAAAGGQAPWSRGVLASYQGSRIDLMA
jgi:hypothetical protein